MIHNSECRMTSGPVIVETPAGVTHNAECFIDGRIMPDEKMFYEQGLTMADLNRIFPNWEQKMPFFVQARWPKESVPVAKVVRQAIITGMMFAVEEILKAKS